MIECHDLSRRYGDFTAVQGISFAVDDGEILGILGPNGAGKTTTIRMITGFLPPTTGTVTVAGQDLLKAPVAARREIGYLPENVALYPEMRVREYLSYRARLEGMGRGPARDAIRDAVERCLITDVEDQIIGTLSKGYRQRVGLASAILHEPRVLVLDEPTVGLDPKQIIAIRELIRELGRTRTLLLSTHILPEVEQLCDRVLIIDKGRLVAEGTPTELRQQSRGSKIVRVTLKDPDPEAAATLGAIDGVATVRSESDGEARLLVEHDPDRDLRETIFRTAVDRGWVLLELTEESASLEDVFVRLTAREDVPESGAEPQVAANESESAEADMPSAEESAVEDDSVAEEDER